ncbi:hypothetical protein PG990_005551 [Apiospora arundinis]|uniref:Uncharacterized protein n=1 Tax=Apiospora arundinis TaxID=335852 RepID=A0ABR2J8F0_9PEZI
MPASEPGGHDKKQHLLAVMSILHGIGLGKLKTPLSWPTKGPAIVRVHEIKVGGPKDGEADPFWAERGGLPSKRREWTGTHLDLEW